jgi:hypothetical protein
VRGKDAPPPLAVRLAAVSALVALVRSRAAMLKRSLPQVRRSPYIVCSWSCEGDGKGGEG